MAFAEGLLLWERGMKTTPARLKVSLSKESQDLPELGVEMRVCESEVVKMSLG